tara:strand:- start:12284 stop:12457 length:174 start_codon:yes stop_codon:yes gene_type:complete
MVDAAAPGLCFCKTKPHPMSVVSFDGQAADNFTALRLYILAFPILPLRLGRMPTTSG